MRLRALAEHFKSSLRFGSRFCWRVRREEVPSLLGFLVDKLGRLCVAAVLEPSRETVPGPVDFRGREEAVFAEGGCALLCRRLRRPEGAEGGGIELLVEVGPDRRTASLCRRTEPLLVVLTVGLVDFMVVFALSYPAPPCPGKGKWLRLGSPIMLLWKSSKLIGARNSLPSGGVWLFSYFVEFPMLDVPRLRRELLLEFVESKEELTECRNEVDTFLAMIGRSA